MINRKYIITAGIFFILLFIGISIYLLIPKSTLVFSTAPDKVVVLIDGKDRRYITNSDSITINPGKHDIIVFRDEFNPYYVSLDLKNNQSTDIVVALTPLTDSAKDILNNPESDAISQRFSSINMNKQTKLTEKLNPIMTILPIYGIGYTIDSCPSVEYPYNPNRIALCVDIPSDEFKDAALLDIKGRGFNPDNFEILWNIYLSEADVTP